MCKCFTGDKITAELLLFKEGDLIVLLVWLFYCLSAKVLRKWVG